MRNAFAASAMVRTFSGAAALSRDRPRGQGRLSFAGFISMTSVDDA